MNALIHGDRVCQIEAETFPVHSDLVWVDCGENITTDHIYVDGNFIAPPEWSAEYRWRELRGHRDAMLSSSDWTQMPDSSADAAVWATYRQELRDLPANTVDPANPVWPEKPE